MMAQTGTSPGLRFCFNGKAPFLILFSAGLGIIPVWETAPKSLNQTNLNLRQVENLREDTDMIGVCDEGVQPLAAGYSGGDGLQLVAAQV